MKQPLRVLHLEDSIEDFELVGRLLSKEGIACERKRVETRTQFFDGLQNESFDLIMADCKLPGFSGLEALEIAQALKPEAPFIFVSGTIGEEAAIESLRNGATDYVLKDQLIRLAPAVRHAVAEAEERMLRRELQQRLRQAARLEAIGTLSNGIAHDFNNILTIILGHVSLLTTEYNKPERVFEIRDTITLAAQRASGIVEQLLAFARKSEGHLAPTDLNHYMRDNLPLLKTKVPRTVEIRFEPGSDLPQVIADSHKIEQILMNLLENSVEAMPGGGCITLSTKLASATDQPDFLAKLGNRNFVCLQVADTGIGMDEMTREHVCEPFYTTKERGHATGLGLPVAYGLMQAQHGSVRVESQLGKGTIVSLFFEALPPAPEKASPLEVRTNSALRGSETVLVVEDEADVSFYLETILESHGYHVLTAYDSSGALKLFEENRDQIALVFSDVGLPKVDGISLCMKLKMLRPDLPVILASGYSPKEFQTRMDELAPKAFLSKPYNTRDILQSVRMVLDGARASHRV